MSRITDRAALNRIAEHGGGTDERIARYQNGYGLWRVEVPETFSAPILAARAAIRYELWERSSQTQPMLNSLTKYVRATVRLSHDQHRAGYLCFEESADV